MVTKPMTGSQFSEIRYILAKNHMVTKLDLVSCPAVRRYILAKNHMVTKLIRPSIFIYICYILAKNHMVTKRDVETAK